jgi:hypothetical protein
LIKRDGLHRYTYFIGDMPLDSTRAFDLPQAIVKYAF